MQQLKNKHQFSELAKALQGGWEIEEPVLLGAFWRQIQRNDQGGIYHFILKNKVEDRTTMISLSPSPQLLVFLAENNIQVSSL